MVAQYRRDVSFGITLIALACLSIVCGQGARDPNWTDAAIQDCLKSPPKSSDLQFVFDDGAKKVINAFFGTKGDCLYGNYCGKICKGGKAIDDLDTCCMNFKKSKYSYDGYSKFVNCYEGPTIDSNIYQCVCGGKVEPTKDKCYKNVRGCDIGTNPAFAKKKAFLDLMDDAVGGEDSGGLAYCFNGNAGGDGEGPGPQ